MRRCSWYALAEKTFRMLGSNKVWQGKAPGSYTVFVKFVPYTPKGAYQLPRFGLPSPGIVCVCVL